MLRAFLQDESGATAIEYALLAAMFSVIVLVAVNLLRSSLTQNYDYIRVTINETMD